MVLITVLLQSYCAKELIRNCTWINVNNFGLEDRARQKLIWRVFHTYVVFMDSLKHQLVFVDIILQYFVIYLSETS